MGARGNAGGHRKTRPQDGAPAGRGFFPSTLRAPSSLKRRWTTLGLPRSPSLAYQATIPASPHRVYPRSAAGDYVFVRNRTDGSPQDQGLAKLGRPIRRAMRPALPSKTLEMGGAATEPVCGARERYCACRSAADRERPNPPPAASEPTLAPESPFSDHGHDHGARFSFVWSGPRREFVARRQRSTIHVCSRPPPDHGRRPPVSPINPPGQSIAYVF